MYFEMYFTADLEKRFRNIEHCIAMKTCWTWLCKYLLLKLEIGFQEALKAFLVWVVKKNSMLKRLLFLLGLTRQLFLQNNKGIHRFHQLESKIINAFDQIIYGLK